MGVNVEAEQDEAENISNSSIGYPTVRESISQEIEAIQKSSGDASIYEIHRRFEEFAKADYSSKPSIEALLGVLGFILFAVTYPFIALGIKLSSKGPVIYKQLRTGKNGEQFICYKFRTMHQIDLRRIDGKPIITKKDDKRVFWFGGLLRRTSLDELPQIINVLKGEMNIIGPRPYPVQECSYWNMKFDDFYYRYATKPGITGLAQVNGYRGGTLDEEHMRKRLDYDLMYVRRASLKLDMYILGKTVEKVIVPDDTAH